MTLTIQHITFFIIISIGICAPHWLNSNFRVGAEGNTAPFVTIIVVVAMMNWWGILHLIGYIVRKIKVVKAKADVTVSKGDWHSKSS